jgi:hypothetical protein
MASNSLRSTRLGLPSAPKFLGIADWRKSYLSHSLFMHLPPSRAVWAGRGGPALPALSAAGRKRLDPPPFLALGNRPVPHGFGVYAFSS